MVILRCEGTNRRTEDDQPHGPSRPNCSPPRCHVGALASPGFVGRRVDGHRGPLPVLLFAGAGHALLNVIGDFLAGTGNVDFRARVSAVWAVGMLGALVLPVSTFGIRGAAAAHAMLFLALAVAYGVGGSPRLGLSAIRLVRPMGELVLPDVGQALTTATLLAIMVAVGFPPACFAGRGGHRRSRCGSDSMAQDRAEPLEGGHRPGWRPPRPPITIVIVSSRPAGGTGITRWPGWADWRGVTVS